MNRSSRALVATVLMVVAWAYHRRSAASDTDALHADAVSPVTGSYAPHKGCTWAHLSDPALGIALVYQRCEFHGGSSWMETSVNDGAVYEVTHYTSGPVKDSRLARIHVYKKAAGESPVAAIKRVIFPYLTPRERKHCQVRRNTRYDFGAGKELYEIVPDKSLAAAAERDGLLGLVCAGQYDDFEFHPKENPRQFVSVEPGEEDDPMFDEYSLTFLPSP